MRPFNATLLLSLVFLSALTFHADAQDENTTSMISTERPSLGPSPDIIGKGFVQAEGGFGLSFQAHHNTIDLPESLLRVGVGYHLEMRVTANDLVEQLRSGTQASEFETSDLSVSTKVLMGKLNGFVPRSAIVNFSLPTGGPTLSSGSIDPTVTLIWSQTFLRRLFVNEVAQGTLTTHQRARRPGWTPSIAAGRFITDKLAVMGEYAPSILADKSLTHAYDAGLTYAPANNRQIDFRAGYLVDTTGRHLLISAGYAIRMKRSALSLE
jgi:hypothetical protein